MNYKRPLGVVSSIIGLILLIGTIELLSRTSGLPGTLDILSGIGILWSEGSLSHDVKVSVMRGLTGWSLGSLAGVVLGLATGRLFTARILAEGFFTLLRAVPFISLVPLSMRIFGLNEAGKVFLVAWASAGVCWLVVHQAAIEISPLNLWRAQSLGASPVDWFFKVVISECSNAIKTALRTALGLGWIVVAVAEMSGVYERSSGIWWSEGLGYRLFRSLDESRDDLLMAAIVMFAFLGIVQDRVFLLVWSQMALLQLHVRKWRDGRFKNRLENYEGLGIENVASPVTLSVSGLMAAYGEKTIFADVSGTVAAGETISVIGPSGSGKTTFIRAVGRFLGGDIQVEGITKIDDKIFSEPGPEVGVVFQEAPVFRHLSVWQNMTFGSRFRKNSLNDFVYAYSLLKSFGLSGQMSQSASTLSGGERQRLALASTLANRPRVILLDEPFGSLDAITRRQLQKFYSENIHGKVTAVLVSHDINEALLLGDVVSVGVDIGDVTPLNESLRKKKMDNRELDPRFLNAKRFLLESLEKATADIYL